MPLVKFIGPHDPRMLSTLDAIDEELVSDSLVYRYDPKIASDDGLGGEAEGSFSLCSFWLVECLAPAASTRRAWCSRRCSPTRAGLGLYASRSATPATPWATTPQAFTHLGCFRPPGT